MSEMTRKGSEKWVKHNAAVNRSNAPTLRRLGARQSHACALGTCIRCGSRDGDTVI